MSGRWAIWPDRIFVTYDQMRMRLYDEVFNKEYYSDLTEDEVKHMDEEDLIELASTWWTFVVGTPETLADRDADDFDYSMNN